MGLVGMGWDGTGPAVADWPPALALLIPQTRQQVKRQQGRRRRQWGQAPDHIWAQEQDGGGDAL